VGVFAVSWTAATERIMQFAQLWYFFAPVFCAIYHLAKSHILWYNIYVPNEEHPTERLKKV
jgi:hypothetical protein